MKLLVVFCCALLVTQAWAAKPLKPGKPDKKTCKVGEGGCTKCSGKKCGGCEEGFSLDRSQGACVKCALDKCAVCDPKKPTKCTKCAEGLTMRGNKCLKCADSLCTECSSFKVCTTCASGYAPNAGGSKCIKAKKPKKCQPQCVTCDNGVCSACAEGFNLVSGKCEEIENSQDTQDSQDSQDPQDSSESTP